MVIIPRRYHVAALLYLPRRPPNGRIVEAGGALAYVPRRQGLLLPLQIAMRYEGGSETFVRWHAASESEAAPRKPGQDRIDWVLRSDAPVTVYT